MDLNFEIKKLKYELEKDFSINKNNFIYLRLSSLDNSIKDTQERIEDTINKLKADFKQILERNSNLKSDGFELYVEVASAYKNNSREEFLKLCDRRLFLNFNIVDLLENKIKTQKNLYVTSFDRLSRIFFQNLTLQLLFKQNNIKVHSLLSPEKILMDQNQNVENEENSKQLMFVFQIMMFSSQASKHSEDLSLKIKKRVTKNKKGETISSKSNLKWGAKNKISDKMKQKIITLFKNHTAKEIQERKDIFQDLIKEKKPISLNTIRSILKNK